MGYIYGYFKQAEGNPRPGVRLASLEEEGGSRGKSKPVILAVGVIWALTPPFISRTGYPRRPHKFKWTPAIALGLSRQHLCHLLINADIF